MNDFFSFRRMIVPMIIQVIFWIGAAISVIVGLVALFGGTGWERFWGVAVILIGPFLVRIWCEFVIVVFRINETLSDIRSDLQGGYRTAAVDNPRVPCSKCGNDNPVGASFCRNCGQRLAI